MALGAPSLADVYGLNRGANLVIYTTGSRAYVYPAMFQPCVSTVRSIYVWAYLTRLMCSADHRTYHRRAENSFLPRFHPFSTDIQQQECSTSLHPRLDGRRYTDAVAFLNACTIRILASCEIVKIEQHKKLPNSCQLKQANSAELGRHGSHLLPCYSGDPRCALYEHPCGSHHIAPPECCRAVARGGSRDLQTVHLVRRGRKLQRFDYERLELRREVRREP